jgi:hypothetical protein
MGAEAALDLRPIARLSRIAGSAHALGEDGMWLADAIAQWMAGAAPNLEAAMGLISHGGVQPVRQARNAQRDELLRRFADERLATSPMADRPRLLAEDLMTFARRRWPRLEPRPTVPPELAGTRDGDLFQLFRVGGVPLSAKQIRRILNN